MSSGTGRALVVAQSALHDEPWMSHSDEYARVLAQILAADLVQLERRPTRAAAVLQHRYRVRNAAAKLAPLRTFELATPRPAYDVAVVVVNNLEQLGRLAAVRSWRSVAPCRIGIVTEVWPPFVASASVALADMSHHFEHLFVGVHGVVEQMRSATSAAVTYLPPAADVLAVEPVHPGERDHDVVNLGRRDPAQHELLRRSVGRYHAPTPPRRGVGDLAAHRREYLQLVGSGRFHVANFARFDQPEVRGDVCDYGYRYFEALAAGSVLVGTHPEGEPEQIVFGGAAPFLDLPLGATTVPPALRRALDDPDLAADLALRHRGLALEGHDVLHRWEAVAAATGLGTAPGAEARRHLLEERRRDLERTGSWRPVQPQ